VKKRVDIAISTCYRSTAIIPHASLNAQRALPVSSRDVAQWHQCFNPKEKATQHETKKVGRVKEELRSEIIVDLLAREFLWGQH
jgi:hypothetical protein